MPREVRYRCASTEAIEPLRIGVDGEAGLSLLVEGIDALADASSSPELEPRRLNHAPSG